MTTTHPSPDAADTADTADTADAVSVVLIGRTGPRDLRCRLVAALDRFCARGLEVTGAQLAAWRAWPAEPDEPDEPDERTPRHRGR